MSNAHTLTIFLESACGPQWIRRWPGNAALKQKFQKRPKSGSIPYFSLCHCAERRKRAATPGNMASIMEETHALQTLAMRPEIQKICISTHVIRITTGRARNFSTASRFFLCHWVSCGCCSVLLVAGNILQGAWLLTRIDCR